ncbi:MAG: 50S ribosomal protein L15 [Elusimicrobiota bacterium]|jgi:large subunit ribosomal protein L15|nr:50S ribosomal protein L15 [Elusimicrobiota bacterium]
MVNLSTLFPKHGSRKVKRRIGLGIGSGMGRSATKGMKGQTSRSGNTRKESKEGGQMPLVRRIPKSGFSNAAFAVAGEFVNIGSLDKKFKAGEEVNPEILKKNGLVHHAHKVKILGNGELKAALNVSAHAFSVSAKAAIEKAGGKAVIIAKKAKAE